MNWKSACPSIHTFHVPSQSMDSGVYSRAVAMLGRSFLCAGARPWHFYQRQWCQGNERAVEKAGFKAPHLKHKTWRTSLWKLKKASQKKSKSELSDRRFWTRESRAACDPPMWFAITAFTFIICCTLSGVKELSDISKHSLLLTSVSQCEQLFSSIMNVKPRTRTRLTDEHLEGCKRIGTK